jgi:sortase A
MTRLLQVLLRSHALERAFRLGGIFILTGCILFYCTGDIGRAVDLAAFDATPDHTLWSPERLKEYQASLGVPIEPAVAVLEVESIGLLVPVYPDTRELHLNRGAGLIAGMASPGKGGNLGIAGHRDGYFRVLKDLEIGAAVVIRAEGWRFVYRVESIDVVEQTELDLLGDTGDPVVTLVTCFPFYFVGQAPQRFIVRALLEHTSSEKSWLSRNTGKVRS